jgi:hypothetical protein
MTQADTCPTCSTPLGWTPTRFDWPEGFTTWPTSIKAQWIEAIHDLYTRPPTP